ncbi:MAG: NADH-quinone oxidoreductase subunit I [candidate division Zixibacteria bacterium]|nr:NADH-quinone oxidoreductase subunit I [candidate division Zixibacteria bacterium]
MSILKKTINGIRNLILGLAVTIKYLLKPAVTLQYPTERWTMPERSRGMVSLLIDKEAKRLRCTGCSLCVKICPNNAIQMVPKKDEQGKRVPDTFVVDVGMCIYCGLCQEVCPFNAIRLVPKYEFSVYDKKELFFDKEKLAEIGKDYE